MGNRRQKKNTNFKGKFQKKGGQNFHKKRFNKDDDQRVKPNFSFDKKTEQFYNSLQEKDLGITEYIGSCEGFSAIIKSRYSDFHVNEIDLDGNIAVLSDLSVPVAKDDQLESIISDPKYLVDKGYISNEQWNNINSLLTGNTDLDFVEVDVTALEKSCRTEIHNMLQKIFEGSIMSSTVSRDDKKFIKCAKYNKKDKTDFREKWLWPHEYTYFILHKVNVDTMKAAMMLSYNLNCRATCLAYAGNKDKRGLTSQWFSLRRRHPAAIMKAASSVPCIKIGNFTFKPTPLKLGQLKGNKFRIALRNIAVDEKIVNDSLEHMKKYGFINYYGLQRFGNCATVPTYKIGQALLKGNWSEACDLILKPREGEPAYMNAVRKTWLETRDPSEALKGLRFKNKTVEGKLLAGLASHGANDFVSALGNIPRNMRLLYIHSYQSFIWNKVTSRRLKEWGQTLRIGDLVLADTDAEENISEEVLVDEFNPNEDIDESDETNVTKVEQTEEEISSFKALAKALTKEDIESNKYTIFDLVLPLPGHDISYPNNESAKWYEEYLAEDGLSNLKQKIKVYSLTGAYRKVVMKADDVKWHFKKYNSPEDTLILSDPEIIKKETLKNFEDGNLKALILEFTLPSSCYATMLLREILKIDTSTSNQIKLTNLIGKDDNNCIITADKEDPVEKINEESDDNAVNKNDKRKLNIDENINNDDKSIENDSKKIKME